MNRILGALPIDEFRLLEGDLTHALLPQHKTLYEPGSHIECVYFPLDCVLSLIAMMGNGDAVEVSVVGCEGFSAPQLVFGSRVPVTEMICQVPGRAVMMEAATFCSRFDTLPHFKRLVLAYMESLFNFMGQTVACNRLHTLTERFARWLLATHDRVGKDEFPLTQEFLAIMLGVARSAVTGAAGSFQQAGIIAYNRGVISIVDRARLEDAACECYAVIAKDLNLTFTAKIS